MHFAGYGDYVSHLQRNQIFTDVTVSIGTEIYAAHRMSLACVSGLFADILIFCYKMVQNIVHLLKYPMHALKVDFPYNHSTEAPLSCVSGLFADIFYIQRNKQHVVLRLTGVKPVAFKVLLQYIYTSVLLITSKVVGDLMRMSEICHERKFNTFHQFEKLLLSMHNIVFNPSYSSLKHIKFRRNV
jgi:hypothetical protein